MKRSLLIASAAALDWALGDPESWPHPVRMMGAACVRGERLLRGPQDTRAGELFAGATLTSVIVAGSFLLTAGALRAAYRLDRRLGAALEIALASTCLASRSLDREAAAVLRALSRADLPLARQRLARIVGRDTASLDEAAISRAVVETLAESASDGIVAPLFYLAAGGVPAAMAFKAASTLDSMIGHRTPQYLYFGRPAARLDDAANLLPARATAWLILLCGASGSQTCAAIQTYRRDRSSHASPNAGHPESAMAGALKIQLGGSSSYDGVPHQAPILGREYRKPALPDAEAAQRLVRRVALLATLLAVGITALKERRGR